MINRLKKLDKIVYVAIVLYLLDILFLGTGEIVKQFGIPTRMMFFCIAVLGAAPGILKDYKKYLKNKYCIIVVAFMLLVVVNMVRGYCNGNELRLIITDVKGFLNFVIVFPMIYALNTRERVMKLAKILLHSLTIMAIASLGLAFYAKFSESIQETIYGFLNGYKMCSISYLTENVTRIFFHTASRWFFMGVVFALVLGVIEKKHRGMYVLEMSLLMSGILVSFTRAFYLGVFISVVALIVLVCMYNKESFSYMMKRTAVMSALTIAIVCSISVGVKDNLFQVAIERCLFSMNVSDTMEENDFMDPSLDGEEDSSLTNTSSEMENLNIRELRKSTALKNISKNPLFGLGLGVANDPEEGIIEYFYLDLCSKMGLFGVVFFVLPYIVCVYDIVAKRKTRSSEWGILNLAANSALLFLMVISYFNPCMNTTVGLSVYGLVMAISCVEENPINLQGGNV